MRGGANQNLQGQCDSHSNGEVLNVNETAPLSLTQNEADGNMIECALRDTTESRLCGEVQRSECVQGRDLNTPSHDANGSRVNTVPNKNPKEPPLVKLNAADFVTVPLKHIEADELSVLCGLKKDSHTVTQRSNVQARRGGRGRQRDRGAGRSQQRVVPLTGSVGPSSTDRLNQHEQAHVQQPAAQDDIYQVLGLDDQEDFNYDF